MENQRQALTEAIERRGWRIVEELVDNGISGAKGRDKRLGYDRLLKAATRGRSTSWRRGRSTGSVARCSDAKPIVPIDNLWVGRVDKVLFARKVGPDEVRI